MWITTHCMLIKLQTQVWWGSFWKTPFAWCRAFNAATLAQQFVAVFLYLVVQTPRCGGSWGLFHNTGLLSQPTLKISMKWTSHLELIMKDWSAWLQDIHENQHPNLTWQIVLLTLTAMVRFYQFQWSILISSAFRLFAMLAPRQSVLVGVWWAQGAVLHVDRWVFAITFKSVFYLNFELQIWLYISEPC